MSCLLQMFSHIAHLKKSLSIALTHVFSAELKQPWQQLQPPVFLGIMLQALHT